MTKFHCSWSSC